MPKKRGRPRKVRPELQIKESPLEKKEPQELEDYVREADEVRQLTQMRGWAILEGELRRHQSALVEKLAYLQPKRPEFYEARLRFIAIDTLLALVNDYEVNRVKAIDLINKLNNPEFNVVMDIDNE